MANYVVGVCLGKMKNEEEECAFVFVLFFAVLFVRRAPLSRSRALGAALSGPPPPLASSSSNPNPPTQPNHALATMRSTSVSVMIDTGLLSASTT